MYRVVLIPADASLPITVEEISEEVSGLDGMQTLVGGPIESIPFPERDDVVPYFNEEGKMVGLPVNRRGTAMLKVSMFPSDVIAGNVVLTGINWSTGETVSVPQDMEALAEIRSYMPQVIADASGKFVGNALRFTTEEEATEYVADLASRWTLVRDTRVVPHTDEANARWENGSYAVMSHA